jgi:DNA-binding IclR family transcriptional regulator
MTLLSVDRTLEVIDILTDRGEVGVSELATVLCVAPSTVHRILATLERRRFVVQDEDSKRYRPGPRMSGLSHDIDLIARSRGLVEKLGTATEMTVHLGILDGRDARYLHHWAPGSRKAIGSRVGTQMHAHVTSAGKALLSACPREQLLRIFPYSTLETATSTSIGDRLRLFEELHQAARSGYARNIEESEPGVVGLATAFSHRATPVAIAVSAWRRDLPLEHDRVSETERRISQTLMLIASTLESHLRAF